MKTLTTLLLAALAACLSGCMASDIINASATKLQVSDASGKSFSLTFPKELSASDFHVTVDPKNGAIKLDASQLKSSSSQLVESAAAAQAQSINTLSNTVSQIVPILAKAAAVAVNPATAAAVEEATAQPASTTPGK